MQLFACPISETGKSEEHSTAYDLLRRVVEKTYRLSLPVIARDYRGKPYFPDVPKIHFNLSHCHGLAVCGISESPLGVDAEEIRPLRERVMRRAFSAEETQAVHESACPDETFFRHWTLKESYVKAIGIGISHPLKSVPFSLNGGEVHTPVTGWQFRQFLVQQRWVISCCVETGDILPNQVIFLPPLRSKTNCQDVAP